MVVTDDLNCSCSYKESYKLLYVLWKCEETTSYMTGSAKIYPINYSLEYNVALDLRVGYP